jgi:hypothetical protein
MDLLLPNHPDRDAGESAEPPSGMFAQRTSGEGETRDPDTQLNQALRRIEGDDVAAWQRLLEAAGFSPSEAQRLIFERLRPRDEGRRRD